MLSQYLLIIINSVMIFLRKDHAAQIPFFLSSSFFDPISSSPVFNRKKYKHIIGSNLNNAGSNILQHRIITSCHADHKTDQACFSEYLRSGP